MKFVNGSKMLLPAIDTKRPKAYAASQFDLQWGSGKCKDPRLRWDRSLFYKERIYQNSFRLFELSSKPDIPISPFLQE